jgi:hypothetical protein
VPHEVPTSRISEIVASIVNKEGPVHEEEIARRVAATYGKDRAGSRIQDAAVRGLKHLAYADNTYQCEDGFWFTVSQKSSPPIRNRSTAALSIQRVAMLPPIEIRGAALKAIADNGAVEPEELTVAVARMFGYQRTGPALRSVIGKVLNAMLGKAELVETAEGKPIRS